MAFWLGRAVRQPLLTRQASGTTSPRLFYTRFPTRGGRKSRTHERRLMNLSSRSQRTPVRPETPRPALAGARGFPPGLGAVAAVPVAAALLIYALTLCRTVYFGDSAELAAAGTVLGIAHPPGYPLYLLLTRLLAVALPGEPALAANVLSALAAALAAGASALLARLLGAQPPAAIAAGLLVAGSRIIWSTAVVAEVYTLNAFLATSLLAALATDEYRPRGDLRALLLAVYLFALGLAHHLTIVHLAMPVLILLVARRRLPLTAIPAALGLGILALSLYMVLLVRSRFDPPLDWGNPETLARLIDHVSARQYQFLMGKMRGPDALARLGDIATLLLRDLGLWLMPALVLGVIALARRPAWLAALALVVITLTAHALAYGIPDYWGHLVPAAVVLAVMTALGLDVAARRLPRAARWLVLVAGLVPLLLHFGAADRSAHRSAREFGENLLAALPPGSTLFAEGDNQMFLLAYLTAACGERPDMTIIDRDSNLLGDFYGFRGESGPLPAAPPQLDKLATEVRELTAWFAADPGRPVYSSARTNLPAAGPFTQEVVGLVFRIRPGPASTDSAAATAARAAADRSAWSVIRTEAIRRDAVHGDALTREVAARYWVRRGEAAFERVDPAAMAAAFDSALALAPDNADLHSYLGAFYGQNDRLPEAIPLLRRAVHLDPLSTRGWTNLGLALAKAGRREEAILALEESLRIQPGQDAITHLLAQLRRR